jgi:replicative DNA helicase
MSDIVKVISKYLTLESVGDEFKACCPFHNEKSASFTVQPEKQFYYCFGCGASGDTIEFIKQHESLKFKDALKIVCEILEVEEKEYMENKEKTEVIKKDKSVPLDIEIVKDFINKTGYKSNGYRGIRDEINKFFGHLTKLDENGKVLARYYPETNSDGKVTGYTCRNHPKDFSYGNIGNVSSTGQMSGQVKFKGGGKYCLLVGGQEDKAAAYQMLLDNQKDREYSTIPVVSPNKGENCSKQVAENYEWFDSHDIIIIGMDNDRAGREAAKKIAEVLPKEKVRIATWTGKDPNEMLQNGQQKQFVRDFYNSKEYVTTGIKGSTDLVNEAKAELIKPVIPLPPYLDKLSKMTKRNGIIQGYIVNIIGNTSCGKTTHINEIAYHWFFNAPELVGIVSLENTAGQYAMDLLSIHLEKNLYWMGDGQEIIDYLDKPEVKSLYDNLMVNEFGEPRFYIIDERDGDIKKLEKQIERMINQYGCKIIIIDVLTDILRSLGNDAQEDHMNWQKLIKKNGITICNVLHTKKPQANQDGSVRRVTEYDALGSSTFVQSADVNIVINRDKMTTDDIEKNTTYWDIPKLRRGQTGHMGATYYDPITRKNYDKDEWLSVRVPEEFQQPEPPIEVYQDESYPDGITNESEFNVRWD